MKFRVELNVNVRFPDPIRIILEQPITRLVFTQIKENPAVPTPITSLTVVVGETSAPFQLDAFAGSTDLGPDTNSPSFSSSDPGIVSINDLGGAQLSVVGVSEGSAVVTGTDAAGLPNTSVTVTVTAPPPPPADNSQFVSLP